MNRDRYIYGRHPVMETLRRSPNEVQRLYLTAAGRSTRLSDIEKLAKKNGIPVVVVPKRQIEDLVGGGAQHQGVAAAVEQFRYADVDEVLDAARCKDEPPLLILLDQIQDPHNLGSLVRSASALGAHGLLIPKDRATEVTPTVVKVSAGATAHLPIVRVTNLRRTLEELKKAGVWVIGAAADGDRSVHEIDFTLPTAIVIGSEGKGLRRMVAESCDMLASIPMHSDLDSLNASVAGALLLYEAARQRALVE